MQPGNSAIAATTAIEVDDDVNLYAYTYNDPLNRRDPEGTSDCETGTRLCKVYGTPQKTGTQGHDTASAAVGKKMVDSGQYKSVHYNQKLSTISGDPAAGGQQPDVAGVRHDGKVDTVEVRSDSQSIAKLDAKGEAMQQRLSPPMRGMPQTVTVEQGLQGQVRLPSGGTVVRGIGVLGFLTGIAGALGAARDNPSMSGIEFMYRAAGQYDVAVEAGLLPRDPGML